MVKTERGKHKTTDPDGRSVYVIEIDPRWNDVVERKAKQSLAPGRCAFYVGETGLYPGARLTKHRRGAKAGSIFKQIRRARERNGEEKTLEEGVDVRLRRDLMEPYLKNLSGKDAKKWEKKVTNYLRSAGHIVFSN